jgi:hypothetical protein
LSSEDLKCDWSLSLPLFPHAMQAICSCGHVNMGTFSVRAYPSNRRRGSWMTKSQSLLMSSGSHVRNIAAPARMNDQPELRSARRYATRSASTTRLACKCSFMLEPTTSGLFMSSKTVRYSQPLSVAKWGCQMTVLSVDGHCINALIERLYCRSCRNGIV